MKKKLIIAIGLVVVMCLLVPLSCAKAPTLVVAPPPPTGSPPPEVVIPLPPEPPTSPEPRFAIPEWSLYTLMGFGGLFLFGLGFWRGRRSAFYY